jgi:fluoroacetyl-CoA thioesterase
MKVPPKIGTTAEKQFVVERLHAIDFADDRMPAVLSTPWLIWFLEHTAREAVLAWLDSDESTVGTSVEINHLAPTPVGQKVTCRARVVRVEDTRISFQLEARDEQELIAMGFHMLQIINLDRFANRVQRKKRAVE